MALAYMELTRDKVFNKLSEEQKLKLVKEVIALGDEAASWVAAEYGIRDPRRIAAEMGVKVLGENRGQKRGAEYLRSTKEIVIYRDYHDKLVREINSSELSEHLLKYLVAHELFCHLELNRIGEVYRKYKFPVWKLGPYVREAYIKGLSKVAARAFTESLLELEISPKVFDYLTYFLFTRQ